MAHSLSDSDSDSDAGDFDSMFKSPSKFMALLSKKPMKRRGHVDNGLPAKKRKIFSNESRQNLNPESHDNADVPACSKTAEAIECSVCLEIISGHLGNPSGCQHKFCVPCIKLWTTKNSTCPLDRIKYDRINVYDKDKHDLIKRIDLEGNEFDVLKLRPREIIYCAECNSCEDSSMMYPCDNCSARVHIECLSDPDAGTTSWLCRKCEGVKCRKMTKKQIRKNISARAIARQFYKVHLQRKYSALGNNQTKEQKQLTQRADIS